MLTDPIADMLARIRNAGQARHSKVELPASKLKVAVAQVLAEAGYLDEVRTETQDGKATLVLSLRYDDDGDPLIDGLRRVSRPGRRVYVNAEQIPQVRRGLGMAVLSTSRGVLSDRSARTEHVGGEVLCEVW